MAQVQQPDVKLPAGFPVKETPGGGDPSSFGQQPGTPVDAPMQGDAELTGNQPSVREIYADRG